jgi:hypothetical protein
VGILCYGDVPAGIGGGFGVLMWVENKSKLVRFLSDHLTSMSPGPASIDHGRVDREIREYLEGKSVQKLITARIQEELNQRLKGFSQFEWIGRFRDLLDGDEEFPRRIRARFRGDRNQPEDELPIRGEEIGDFKDSLREYGI